MTDRNRQPIPHIGEDLEIEDLESHLWLGASPITVNKYWSGEAAPDHRSFDARLVWSGSALHVRFDATQGEPLVINPLPDLTKKTLGLWEKDVCEIFIAPDRSKPDRYFEFEVAPTGEWLDIAVEATPGGRKTVWEYASGSTAAASIETGRVVMAMRIPFEGLGARPQAGDVWRGNLFRCVGSGETRGYLAWRPTFAEKPNFHLPEHFGELYFVG